MIRCSRYIGSAPRRLRSRSTSISALAWIAFTALGLAAWAPRGAEAQAEGAEVFGGDVEVRLVEVEVHVTDRQGHPLTGLTAEDFELEVNREEQKIEFFEARSPVRVADSAESDLEQKPLYLAVYVDRRFIEPGELDGARPMLERFLLEHLRPIDQVLLATADDEGLKVLQSYTTDHQAVVDHLARLDGKPGAGRLTAAIGALLRDLNQELRLRSTLSMSTGIDPAPQLGTDGGGGDPSGASERVQRQGGDPRSLLTQIDGFSDRVNRQLASVAGQLGQLVGSLSGLPGRKQVLYVGGSLPVRAPLDLFHAWRDVYDRPFNDSDYYRSSEREGGNNDRFMLDSLGSKGKYMAGIEMFENLGRAASSADVAFNTINVSPGRKARRLFSSGADVEISSGGTDQSNLSAGSGRDVVSVDDGLESLALITGGRHTSRLKKLDGYFSGLANDQQTRYVLGFTADPEAGSGQKISVRLKKSKDRTKRRANVRHRTHFAVKSRVMELAERTLSHLMVDTAAKNPLGITVEVGAPEARAEDWRLQIKIMVPLSELVLVPDRRSHSGRLSIYATAGGLGQGFAPIMQTMVPVRLSNSNLLTALGRQAEYELDLRVPKDPQRVAVTVRDEYGPVESTITAAVGMPEWLPEVDSPGEPSSGPASESEQQPTEAETGSTSATSIKEGALP